MTFLDSHTTWPREKRMKKQKSILCTSVDNGYMKIIQIMNDTAEKEKAIVDKTSVAEIL